MGFLSGSNEPAVTVQLLRLERKLDALLAHFEVELPDDGMNDLRDMIAAGNKIGAIKEYRARTGASLAEAKKAVDAGL